MGVSVTELCKSNGLRIRLTLYPLVFAHDGMDQPRGADLGSRAKLLQIPSGGFAGER